MNDKGVYIIIYVDDCLLVGKQEEIDNVLEALKEFIKIKCMGKVQDYIGFHIEKEDYGYKYTQPKLISRIIDKFGEEMIKIKYHGNTPTKTNDKIYVAENETEIMEQEGQTNYCSGIGMLL